MAQAAGQRPGIFICYRRDDSAGHAGRLYDRLSAHFGDEQIFMDLDRIEAGEDFVQVIEEAVGSCEILLALIGRSWLTSQDEVGRRLDNPNDFVRVELAAAFARDIRVIPVLVQGAQMPRPQDLPEALRSLSRRHAFDLSDQRWRQDVDRLVGTLEKILASQRESRRLVAEEEEAERRRREAEARRQAESEAEAQRQAEENERLRQAAAEAERRRREAEEAERVRRETEESERRVAEPSASAVTEITEPAKETHTAREPFAVKTPSVSPFGGRQRLAALTTPATKRARARARLILIFALLSVAPPVAIWVLTRPNGEDTKVAANQNASLSGTPPAGQKGAPTPTGETPTPPPGMVYVPGGDFTMGRDDGDEFESPAHRETLKAFFIDAYEVTCGDYEEFVRKESHPPPPGWKGGACPAGAARKPITGVRWGDAVAFCYARAKRLPTEQEWELAARGTDGRRYPWGNEWRARSANADGASGGVVEVGSYPEGKSPSGAFDMVGNAWEWTAATPAPYPPKRELPIKVTGDLRVIRGGSFAESRTQATATYRGYLSENSPHNEKTGFRCAKDAADAPGQ